MRAIIFKLYRLQYWSDRDRWVLAADGERLKQFASKATAVAALGTLVKRPGVVEIYRKDGTRQGCRYYDRKRGERV